MRLQAFRYHRKHIPTSCPAPLQKDMLRSPFVFLFVFLEPEKQKRKHTGLGRHMQALSGKAPSHVDNEESHLKKDKEGGNDMKNKLLVVVDMQNDFITGSLGSDRARAIVPRVCKKIRNWHGPVVLTQDSHPDDYMGTLEGARIPVPHCIEHTNGHQIDSEVMNALVESDKEVQCVPKQTFGCMGLGSLGLEHYDSIEIVGLCTDICVLANAVLMRTMVPNVPIVVDASCCAGVTLDSHCTALRAMKMLCIDVINE